MRIKFIIVFLFSCLPFFAQIPQEAQKFFLDGKYVEAKKMYSVLLKGKPKDVLYNYRYARCCYELKQTEEAIKYFELVKKGYYLRDYCLGDLYFQTYRFTESVEAYSEYLSTLKETDVKYTEVEQKLSKAELAERLLARVEDIAIIDSITVDKDKFLQSYKFSSDLGTLKQEKINLENHFADKITYTTQRKDRMYYSDVDSTGTKMDIYTSYKLLDGWSAPVSFSEEVNSTANENYPFLLLDGVTMYLASDGENSLGGYDIFITRFMPASNSYLAPENIGMPFNSPFNDYMMVVDDIKGIGWFATDRYQPEGKVTIYTFQYNEEKNILRSEDEDHIRNVAQLKTFTQAEINLDEKDSASEDSENVKSDFEFFINDKLIYTQKDQFKSPEGKKAFQELTILQTQLKNMKEQLTTLRNVYSLAKNDSEREDIAPKILHLEQNIQNQEKLIEEKTVNVRNEEIKFLSL